MTRVKGPAIGIDLGTRNALTAFADSDGTVRLIPNRRGNVITPSVAAWEDGTWLVGEDAARLALSGSENVWWDLKRKVGSSFRVSLDGVDYATQDMLVPLLSALREDAEAWLGTFVSSCVLAVPACFSLAQRETMAGAANAAGIEDARIVAEPTAAALASGQEGRFLVLDFGAGTTDLSVVESGDGVWQVLESAGTDTLGGCEFDAALAGWLQARLFTEPPDKKDPRWRLLLSEAEKIKISLSDCKSLEWSLPSPGGMTSLTIHREDLERLIRFPIRRLVHTVRRLWLRYEPERLLLVGGSSRIPLLMDILRREVALPERLSLSAEDAVVRGAALCASGKGQRLLLDALSGDLVVLWEGRAHRLIPSEAPLPAKAELKLEAVRTGKQGLEIIQQSRSELHPGKAALVSTELDVRAGEKFTLSCELSVSGSFSAELQRERGRRVSLPLRADLKAAQDGRGRDTEMRNSRRLRELKLSLAGLETLLTGPQQDHLHRLFQRAEEAPSDPEILNLLEGLARDLKQAVAV